MTIPSKAERDMMLAQAIRVLVAMVYAKEMPNAKRIGQAITTSINMTAHQFRGSVRGAAKLMHTAHSTFLDQVARGLPDVLSYLPMHDPLDDQLFPFIRIQFGGPDLAFVEEYFGWLESTVQPRAHTESTKLVILGNFSAWEGDMTPEFVQALVTGVQTRGDASVVRGIVFFSPTMPDIMTTLGVVNQGNELDNSGLIRHAISPQAALDHAASLFATASVSPPQLSLD